ncbi:hypothetical protein SAMN05216548_108187 [Faunimonas pinastri]|uniref:Uncharacterized protein n=1 Tax=Faunimonas pinastri TaxID=1855383 RepID=A0A1H9JMT0_9HYPH|nr:hypothetical protein SAMN05216548_108187 [Faunimonas pinastri]
MERTPLVHYHADGADYRMRPVRSRGGIIALYVLGILEVLGLIAWQALTVFVIQPIDAVPEAGRSA